MHESDAKQAALSDQRRVLQNEVYSDLPIENLTDEHYAAWNIRGTLAQRQEIVRQWRDGMERQRTRTQRATVAAADPQMVAEATSRVDEEDRGLPANPAAATVIRKLRVWDKLGQMPAPHPEQPRRVRAMPARAPRRASHRPRRPRCAARRSSARSGDSGDPGPAGPGHQPGLNHGRRRRWSR